MHDMFLSPLHRFTLLNYGILYTLPPSNVNAEFNFFKVNLYDVIFICVFSVNILSYKTGTLVLPCVINSDKTPANYTMQC